MESGEDAIRSQRHCSVLLTEEKRSCRFGMGEGSTNRSHKIERTFHELDRRGSSQTQEKESTPVHKEFGIFARPDCAVLRAESSCTRVVSI